MKGDKNMSYTGQLEVIDTGFSLYLFFGTAGSTGNRLNQ
jgi:hypothetical protein